MRFMALLAASLLAATAARAEPAQNGPRAGDTYEVRIEYETASKGSGGSSSSSGGHNVLMERVIAVREDGLELEYDLPEEENSQRKAVDWEYPTRVFRPRLGSMQLLNAPELEARIEDWLKKAEWTREVCGHWIFTWTVFKIECDPQSVIRTLENYDLRAPDLREGASYRDKRALGRAPLARKTAKRGGATFTAKLKIDPEMVRRQHAESDVVVGEIIGKTLTLEAALLARAAETASGTMTFRFDTDASGQAWRRTSVTRLEIRKADGEVEKSIATEIVERRLVSRGGG